MNKSLVTNLVSLACAGVGFLIPNDNPFADPVRQVGLYATSGAITNWIAIYMLFEKVPGLYGSGVIPSRFEEFKAGIRRMIMDQFFTRENVSKFFQTQANSTSIELKPEPLLEAVDYDAMFLSLQDAVMSSSFGGMIGMFGGAKALEALRVPFKSNMESEIRKLVESPKLQEAIRQSIQTEDLTEVVIHRVDGIVNARLNELTPTMVKEIVQDMIRQHLGWLVVWGGVFGALIGLVASLLRF